jgi:hypothetical protein
VRLPVRDFRLVLVLVVRIVRVDVLVLGRRVNMLMGVTFAEHQRDPGGHDDTGNDVGSRQRLREDREGHDGPDERSSSEDDGLAGGTE